MAEMTIQKSQAFPVGKDLNKGKSSEDSNKASLDFNAFLRSSKEDTVKNEGDRKSKSQENSEKKTEQNSIEKDPKEAKLQKGEKKTEKKETKTEEKDSLQGEKAASLVSEKQLLFQKDQLMADIKIAVEEGAVEAVSDLTAVAEPVSIPLTEESALVTVLPEGKEETPVLAENATKKDFSDFLQEDSKDATATKTAELKEGASLVEDKSLVEAPKEENIIPSQRLEEKLSQRVEEKKSGKEEKLDKMDGHAGQQISLPGSQEKLSESVNAPVREEAVLHSSEAKLPGEVGGGFNLTTRRAPDVRAALADVYAEPNDAPFLLPLNQLLGFIGAHEWHKKGINIPRLNGKIHVPFGVFSPLRGEYLDLIAQAPLAPNIQTAFVMPVWFGGILLYNGRFCPSESNRHETDLDVSGVLQPVPQNARTIKALSGAVWI